MAMSKSIFFASILAALPLSSGCAVDHHRDCWFEYSNPIDYSAVLRPPADPLVDLWFLPYSPCTFHEKPADARDRD
jgi:hypothetical protein